MEELKKINLSLNALDDDVISVLANRAKVDCRLLRYASRVKKKKINTRIRERNTTESIDRPFEKKNWNCRKENQGQVDQITSQVEATSESMIIHDNKTAPPLIVRRKRKMPLQMEYSTSCCPATTPGVFPKTCHFHRAKGEYCRYSTGGIGWNVQRYGKMLFDDLR
ncbi:hypothetical protein RFI_25286 [Reticulomyxa filosa]|uniref:Uncharacterized protein n=1 Tax=Reticulomyxa filosa TaxID=46433 RepID=X6MGB1_RETFI|nr:hypothetical protein RFI_25286 [Reticulomyxa filosa]|eukprot:ETO12090.1 hypothetical protein RFI_25286 [Reticulomyxa filosa]